MIPVLTMICTTSNIISIIPQTSELRFHRDISYMPINKKAGML